MKILWAVSGSFCNHAMIIQEIKKMKDKEVDITVLLSDNSANLSTRFGTNIAFKEELYRITKKPLMIGLVSAETVGPSNQFDCMVIAPCTSTVLSKLAFGDYNHSVCLSAKAMLRNQKPVVIAVASNDILGNSAEALFKLKQTKNIYFVPLLQDDAYQKPNSCIARWSLIEKTISKAINGVQIQPFLYVKERDYE